MEKRLQAIKRMEYDTATQAGVSSTQRFKFLQWYRKTLDYKLKMLGIRVKFFRR